MKVVCKHCLSVNNIPSKDSYKKANCGKCKNSLLDTSPIDLTTTNFDDIIVNSDLPIIVDFWAPWCGPCKMLAPVLDEISDEFDGKVTIAKVNIDDNPASPGKYGVRGIPTMLLFKNGELKSTKVGATTKSNIVSWIKENI